MPDSPYRAASVALQAGDCMVFYTDGLTDAEGESGGRFGKERLFGLVAAGRTTARGLVDELVAALKAHLGKASPADDVTLLIVRKKP
jgi:sigma-B regulation protein RsbU (phosphoserine phosphatase)